MCRSWLLPGGKKKIENGELAAGQKLEILARVLCELGIVESNTIKDIVLAAYEVR